MPQIIEVDGTEYEFPDSMSDDQIRAALGRVKQPKLSAPKAPDSMGMSALKSGVGTVVDAVKQPLVGLKDLASTVVHDPELLRGSPLEGLLPGGHLAVAAGKAIAGQSIDALKRMVQPDITPIERVSHGLSAVPMVGPAAQQMGMKLGVGSTYARPTGEATSPQDSATFGEGVGELGGNAALLGLGKGVSKIGEALVRAKGRAHTPDAGTLKSAIQETNGVLGIKPKHIVVDNRGRQLTNPAAEVLAQGIDPRAPINDIVRDISTKIDQLTMKKDAILTSEKAGAEAAQTSPDAMPGVEQFGGQRTYDIHQTIDSLVRNAKNVGKDSLAKNLVRLKREYLQNDRKIYTDESQLVKDDLNFVEADNLARDLWSVREHFFGGKKNKQPLARDISRAFGDIKEGLPREVQALDTQIRNLIAAREAGVETAKAGGSVRPAKPPYVKDVATFRKVIRHTPPLGGVFSPLGNIQRIAKMLERMAPGGD